MRSQRRSAVKFVAYRTTRNFLLLVSVPVGVVTVKKACSRAAGNRRRQIGIGNYREPGVGSVEGDLGCTGESLPKEFYGFAHLARALRGQKADEGPQADIETEERAFVVSAPAVGVSIKNAVGVLE